MATQIEIKTATQAIRLALHPRNPTESHSNASDNKLSNLAFSKLANLAIIFRENEEKDDYLSQRLHKWGSRFLTFVREKKLNPCEEDITRQMNKLIQLLQDPFYGTLLKDPWLVGDIVWEKDILKSYTECYFQVHNQLIKATPHTFAQNLLSWLDADVTPLELQKVKREEDTIDPKYEAFKRLERFKKLIADCLKERNLLAEIKEWKECNRVQDVVIQKNKERERQGVKRLEKSHKKETKELKKSLGCLREERGKSNKTLLSSVKEIKNKQGQTQKELGESQQREKDQAGEIGKLWNEISDLRSKQKKIEDNKNNNDLCVIL